MQKLAKSKTGKDRHKDFRRHQRAPGKGPTLFHATDDEWQRRREDDRQPDMQAFRTHCKRRAAIDRRDISHTSFGGDDDRPESFHHDHEQHRRLGLPEPKQREWNPTNAWQCLQSQRRRSERVAQQIPARSEESQWQANDNSEEIADKEPKHRDRCCVTECPIFNRALEIIGHLKRGRQQYRRPDLCAKNQMPQQKKGNKEKRSGKKSFHLASWPRSWLTFLSERMIFVA